MASSDLNDVILDKGKVNRKCMQSDCQLLKINLHYAFFFCIVGVYTNINIHKHSDLKQLGLNPRFVAQQSIGLPLITHREHRTNHAGVMMFVNRLNVCNRITLKLMYRIEIELWVR